MLDNQVLSVRSFPHGFSQGGTSRLDRWLKQANKQKTYFSPVLTMDQTQVFHIKGTLPFS